jgi:O-antigen biosynthesis alpha-1,2-mannosyltransferase
MAKRAGGHEMCILLNALLGETIDLLRARFDNLVDKKNIIAFRVPGPTTAMFHENRWRMRAAELIREHMLHELEPDLVHISSLFEGFSDDSVTSVKSAFPTPTAATFYDAIPYMRPDTYLQDENTRSWYFEKIVHLKRADLLLAISESTRREGIEKLGIAPGNIVNVSTAVDDRFRRLALPDDVRESLRRKYGLMRPFIMYTGVMEERKNIEGLLRAYSLLPSDVRRRHQLALICQPTEMGRASLAHLIKKNHLADDEVVITGFVPDDDLIALYNLCRLFVLPSFHEGFGLPALEAMACGTPTIGSNCSSIPEVIGRPDALFDPTHPGSIAERINQALTDNAYIETLRRHASVQAARFSWDETARRTLDALVALYASKPRTDVASTGNSNSHRHVSVGASQRPVDGEAYRALVREIVSIDVSINPAADDWPSTANSIGANLELIHARRYGASLPRVIKWRVEGPFDSSYSLALLNRETARALAQLGHQVALHSTEGPGDFEPNKQFLLRHHDVNGFYEARESLPPNRADVVSRNLYPPRVHDVSARINLLHHFAWEESALPQDWVSEFNTYLQGLTCLSDHVEKVLIDNGVTVPLKTSGCGVDHWERIHPNPNYKIAARRYRFLHVSSCFPRKGVDVLLAAYGRAFRNTDDVTLIIKAFPNPHNDVRSQLESVKARDGGYPDVQILEDDLTDADLKSLYQQCHALVAPSRAEGFGLPLAEAMLTGLPVITTAWGGQLAFCDDSTSWLVDYRFEYARTHFKLFNSVWANPDAEHLASTLRQVYEAPRSAIERRVEAGRQTLRKTFSWVHVTKRLVDHGRAISERLADVPHNAKVGWITTWNTRCGIAEYSAHLLEHFRRPVTMLAAHAEHQTGLDSEEVVRCWYSGAADELAALSRAIEQNGLDTLVIQFNYYFFDFKALSEFLNRHADAGRTVFIILHSTSDPLGVPSKRLSALISALGRCDRVLVHSVNDLNTLKDLGLVNNVCLFPHGIVDQSPSRLPSFKQRYRKVIASYGFFLPQKGLPQLIDALAKLISMGEDVELLMINAAYTEAQSGPLIQQAKRAIKKLRLENRIKLVTDFLPDEASLGWLTCADLVVFPYQATSESSSAAVRVGLASKKPVAVTPLPIFDDVRRAVFTLPGTSSEQLARGISEVLHTLERGGAVAADVMEQADRWRNSHRYPVLAHRLSSMLFAIGARKPKRNGSGRAADVSLLTAADAYRRHGSSDSDETRKSA